MPGEVGPLKPSSSSSLTGDEIPTGGLAAVVARGAPPAAALGTDAGGEIVVARQAVERRQAVAGVAQSAAEVVDRGGLDEAISGSVDVSGHPFKQG